MLSKSLSDVYKKIVRCLNCGNLKIVDNPCLCETKDKFDKIIVTHTCRFKNELHYSEKIINECINNEILKSVIGDKLIYYKSTTQENSKYTGRRRPMGF